MARYSIELYNSQNSIQTLVADITPLVETFNYTVPLNNFEELTFSMNKNAWKNFCTKIGINPYISIRPLTAEIKLRRNDILLPMAFEIKLAPKKDEENSNTVQITARGTLSKLGDATITGVYTQVDATEIARSIIATRQAREYGDFGITNGNPFLTGVPTDRTYTRYSCMDAIRNPSDDASGGFDFYFDHDWKFYTMLKRGSLKNDIVYSYGSEISNVISYENPEDGTAVVNAITAVGEGIGDPMIGYAIDVTSAQTYGLREKPLIYSNIDNQEWLNSKAASELADRKDIYDLPAITVSGEVFDLNDKWTGDIIPIVCTDEASPYVGNGRIKEMSITVDVNHQERITLECLKA